MTEITIKIEDEIALQKLLQFIKKIGLDKLVIEQAKLEKKTKPIRPNAEDKKKPSIQWAKEPEKAKDFFGIWKDNPVDVQKLRISAWRGRL